MTEFADPQYLIGTSGTHSVARFSPDGKEFVVIVRHGDIETNTNEYSLLMFRTNTFSAARAPDVLVSFSSSSNRPAIQDAEWVNNRTIVFLGEHPGEEQELYTIDCDTKVVGKLTNHPTSLTAFTIARDSNRIVFAARSRPQSLVDENATRRGITVRDQFVGDLITLSNRFQAQATQGLFVQQGGSHQEHPLRTHNVVARSPFWLSPDGHYLIVTTFVIDDPPAIWKEYRDDVLQAGLQTRHAQGEALPVSQFELIDTWSGDSRPLLNSPIAFGGGDAGVAWSPDSKSVVVATTYLPLDGVTAAERHARQSKRFVAEIRIASGEVVPITDQELKLRRWDAVTGNVFFATGAGWASGSLEDLEGELVAYRKIEGGWKKVNVKESEVSPGRDVEVTLEEGMNAPPKIFAKNVKSGKKSLLLNLNPDFETLLFGRVEDISFRATDGHMVRAGLYLPVGYEPGKRYPLVIQTHGWNPRRFRIDGPFPTGFAAQPLAGKGFVVAQLDEDLSHLMTPSEVSEEAAAYEGVIDYLDQRRVIDRHRVGIIAFSRTGLGVEYALTHSKYALAAVSLDDISDLGYFRYLAFLNVALGNGADNEGINGGLPFGSGLTAWLKNAPGFNLDRVAAPVLMQATSPNALFFEWEWFVGLSRLGKPVDLVLIPNGEHVLMRPWDRMISQQGNVDWFRFWLKNEEDPDPTKAEQYARWRELRMLEQLQPAADTGATRR